MFMQLVGAGGTSINNPRMNRGVYRQGIVYLKDTYDPAAHQSQGVNYDWTSHKHNSWSDEYIVSSGGIGTGYWRTNVGWHHTCTSHYAFFNTLNMYTGSSGLSGIRYIMYACYVAGVETTDGHTWGANQVDQIWETAWRSDGYDTTENTNTLNVFSFLDNSNQDFYKRLRGTNHTVNAKYPNRKCFVYVIEAKTNGGGTRLYNRGRFMRLFIISQPCSTGHVAYGNGTASGNGETLTRGDGTDLTHYYP